MALSMAIRGHGDVERAEYDDEANVDDLLMFIENHHALFRINNKKSFYVRLKSAPHRPSFIIEQHGKVPVEFLDEFKAVDYYNSI